MIKPTLTPETREVFLPAKVLELCLEDWDDASDEQLAQAVGETMEHAYVHLRWLLAIRQHRCRLVVVQLRNPHGTELNPHYQLGELSTLSGWHPERAIEEARELLNDSGDGLTFDLPIEDDTLREWEELAQALGLEESADRDEPQVMEILASAMVLLDDAHDDYVSELGDDFYIAVRGLERSLERLETDPFGRWSVEAMQIEDTSNTVAMAQVYPDPTPAQEGKVPTVYQPDFEEENENA